MVFLFSDNKRWGNMVKQTKKQKVEKVYKKPHLNVFASSSLVLRRCKSSLDVIQACFYQFDSLIPEECFVRLIGYYNFDSNQKV
mmetsp:Transcript_55270/g.63206  ORF Transcript_55270/g.63206 Transcript_55270/m.63206 type:complete len:84 (-) Transcript_55270:886-1137(-)